MDAGTLLTGLFGGAGATLLWEMLMRPLRRRRELAEALSAEVSHNIQIIAAALVKRTQTMVPSDFSVSTMVFTATVAELGVLPTTLIGECVLLYRHFEELNKMRDRYEDAVTAIRSTPESSRLVPQLKAEAQAVVDLYNAHLETVANRLNIVQPMLLAEAFPDWSPRSWNRAPSESLPLKEAARRARESQARRDTINQRLKDSGGPGRAG